MSASLFQSYWNNEAFIRKGRASVAEGQGGSAEGAVHGGHDGLEGRRDDVGVDADAPEDGVADGALEVRRGLGVPAGRERVLVIVEAAHVDAVRPQRLAERRDRAVSGSFERDVAGGGVIDDDREGVDGVDG